MSSKSNGTFEASNGVINGIQKLQVMTLIDFKVWIFAFGSPNLSISYQRPQVMRLMTSVSHGLGIEKQHIGLGLDLCFQKPTF